MKPLRHLVTTILVVLVHASLPAQEVRQDTLEAARVTALKRNLTGALLVKGNDIKTLITPLGDGSAIKFIQTLPGVATGAEGSSAFYVRGGNLGSNVITIDGVPLYGSGHMLGFSTAYSPDIVSDTRFMVGGFSSEEGNLTSSHIKVVSRDGDFTRFSGGVSVSPFILGGYISTPVVKDKVSFLGSVRVSPIGPELRAVKGMTSAMDSITGIKAAVGDAYGKIKWLITPRQSLSLSGLTSVDSYGYSYGSSSEDRMGWFNGTVSLTHDLSFGTDWSISSGLSANRFANYQGMRKTLGGKENSVALWSGLEELSAKSDALWESNGWRIQSGLKARLATFNPGASSVYNDKILTFPERSFDGNSAKTLLLTAHAQIRKSKEERYELTAAGRINRFSSGRETYNGYDEVSFAPEVSLSGKVFLVRNMGLEMTLDKTVQYYHTLEGIPLGWSLDMIVPSDAILSPEKALQAYLGLFLSNDVHRLTVGAYVKKMDNLLFFKDPTLLFSSASAGWRDNIKTGTGESKGIEVLYEFDLEKLGARVSYTLSKTDRLFPDINDGEPFPAKFDRRHIFNARFEYAIVKTGRRELGANSYFTFQSGHWATVAAGQFSGWISPGDKEIVVDYHSKTHNWQAPPYIRLDIGAFLRYGIGTSHPGMLNVGIYNLLNRHNIYSIVYDPTNQKWKSLSIFPIMPTISWTMEF